MVTGGGQIESAMKPPHHQRNGSTSIYGDQEAYKTFTIMPVTGVKVDSTASGRRQAEEAYNQQAMTGFALLDSQASRNTRMYKPAGQQPFKSFDQRNHPQFYAQHNRSNSIVINQGNQYIP